MQARTVRSASGCDERDGTVRAPGPNELRALTAFAFDEVQGFPGAVRDMHLGIAGRAFRATGSASRPVQLIHDAVSRGAYGAVGSAGGLLARATGAVIDSRGIGEELRISHTRHGSNLIGALTGLRGDRLERVGSELHQPPSVRLAGEPVALTADSLGAAFPTASGRLVVFLHGLMCTEYHWTWGSDEPADSYGARLSAELGYTPVYLRYNSGLHISENGRSVAALLEQLLRSWPARVRQIALVGHSMGGLVARSAAHQSCHAGDAWPQRVSHVITLGTPHLGAPLEQVAHRAAAALYPLPETRMFGTFLRKRSAGIRDLRGGSLVDEDWQGRDPDALQAVVCKEVPLLAGATHCFVSATITRDADHPLGRLLGDALVLKGSATGQGRARRIALGREPCHHVAPTHHLALLNHPDVYEQLRSWLGAPGPVCAREACQL